jgi:penicillin-binding protein 1A
MANSLKDTPSAWVHFDKDAKDPISFDKLQLEKNEGQKEYRASPPLARPLYRPAPVAPTRSAQTDFSDLPDTAPSDEEQIIVPAMETASPQKEHDGIENLINNIQ